MSTMLSRSAVDAARRFVDQQARPLERARLACLLDDAPPSQVAKALAAFRTSDGGIGHALEPDSRFEGASVIGALTALDTTAMHDVPDDHPLVTGIVRWLLDHAEKHADGWVIWPFLPEAAQSAPHAPWWDQAQPGALSATFAGYRANPGLALTAHLHRIAAANPGLVPAETLDRLTEQALRIIAAGIPADEVNAHDAAAHLAGEPAVPAHVRAAMTQYLAEVLPGRIMRSRSDFDSYGIHPLWIAPTPDHPLAPTLTDAVDTALDVVIESQSADGSWQPFWSWAGGHPQEWEVARTEWAGTLVVRNLAALQAWGRLA